MGHFIWSQSLSLMLFMVASYALMRVIDDKSWMIVAGIAIGSMMVTQPIVSAVFGIMMIFLFITLSIRDLISRKLSDETKRVFMAGLLGILVSMIFWAEQLATFGISKILELRGGQVSFSEATGWSSAYAMQKYSLSEFIFATDAGRIDQATGIGWGVAILLVITIIIYFLNFKKITNLKKNWRYTFLIAWFTLLLMGVFAATWKLSIPGPARNWAYFAIPLALIVTDGLFILLKSVRKLKPQGNMIAWAVILVVVSLVIVSGGMHKYNMQTGQWPPGVGWTSQEQIDGFIEMEKQLPPDQRVYTLCGNPAYLFGFNQIDYKWIPATTQFRIDILNKTGDDVITFMEEYGYKYVVLDSACIQRHGVNDTQLIAARLSETQRFVPVIQKGSFVLAGLV
ncbi:hypothetical protein GOV11_02870 [Candidatus Woesearchaeota archaeon]|nr:hypothetical protein [Candidatus Woesearchaeota archaeon]